MKDDEITCIWDHRMGVSNIGAMGLHMIALNLDVKPSNSYPSWSEHWRLRRKHCEVMRHLFHENVVGRLRTNQSWYLQESLKVPISLNP